MSDTILVIVEGRRLEPKIVSHLKNIFGLKCKIASLCTNIHILYNRLKCDDGFTDVIPVLKEILNEDLVSAQKSMDSRQEKAIREDLDALEETFSSVYLIFDSELHHREKNCRLSELEIVNKNVEELGDMLEFFNNDTEQGKLFINYPMMESFRDCMGFFDNGFKDTNVHLDILFGRSSDGIRGYKDLVNQRGWQIPHINRISAEDFSRLILMNVFKLHQLAHNAWSKMEYSDFVNASDQKNILYSEQNYINKNEAVAVLNTSLFIIIDYKGKSFFDGLQAPEP